MSDMVHCRGCGAEIHRSAVSCPRCGAQQRTGRVKSKVAAGVLALLLGWLGIHRFYLGQWWGVFYLLFFWTGIPGLVSLIEGIVFLCTSQENWDARYNQGIPSDGGGTAVVVVAAIAATFLLVAVMGILAAIAIPAYADYTIRVQVTEGLNLASEARMAVTEAISDRGAAPADRAAAGLPPESGGQYVEAVSIENGRVDILYGNAANKRISQHVLSLTPYLAESSDGSFDVLWRCGYGPVPAAATHEIAEYDPGDMEPRHLPATCR